MDIGGTMSKEIFGKKISESMYKKIKAIEKNDVKEFLEKDENFEIALCLSYMTLSKEKIIAKDMKNNNRMERLTKMVDTSEIDKVFQTDFAKEMPKIIYAKENNNLWILDNIRDSIMHGTFDIDEERKCFLINNKQYDRELNAEVPFSWFVEYARNDILSKKKLERYTVKGFYYNKYKTNKKNLITNKELINNILYRVDIEGNQFNVKDIENRVNELFDIYSKEEIPDESIEKYRSQSTKEKVKYNERYLVSFYIASEKIKECIEKEFPGVNVKIFIDNRKSRLINKISKKLPKFYSNYDLMFNDFNKQISPKGLTLLKYITNIIENLNKNENDHILSNSNNFIDNTNQFNKILNNEEITFIDNESLKSIAQYNLEMMRTIFLNVYALSTLVINHENLYNEQFFNQSPSNYGIYACSKKYYLEYAQKRKKIIMKILETELALFSKREQFNHCSDGNIQAKIQLMITNLLSKKAVYENELCNLYTSTNFDQIVRTNEVDYDKKEKIEKVISKYFEHFDDATTLEGKKKIKKIIGELLDIQIEEESKYTYGYCNNMKDVLTIIRNCFSHIGRTYIGKDRGEDTNIVLNDYDSDGKSGEVVCKYDDLIDLLRNPYLNSKKNNKK